MADYYVYSGATGTGDGSSWANAYTTLSAAIASKAAGDRFFVANDHNEAPGTAQSYTFPGTAANFNQVICVNRAGSIPPAAADITTGAQIAPSGTNSITFVGGHAYIQGLRFVSAAEATAGLVVGGNTAHHLEFENCAFKINTTSSSRFVSVGSGNSGAANQRVVWRNTTVEFGGANQAIFLGNSTLDWLDTPSALVGATLPTTLITINNGSLPWIRVRGVDLSALGSGNNLVNAGSTNAAARVEFANCKLGASVAVTTGTITGTNGVTVDLWNCDSGDTTYREEHYRYQGDTRQETTIVRSSGASDGATAISWKMASNANAAFKNPLESPPIFFRYDGTLGASKTATVEIVNDGTTLKDDEIWGEVEYLGTSGFPRSSLANDAKANVLATGANQTTSSATWTTTGLTSPVKQKLDVSFTPQEAGVYIFRAKLGKASQTVYVDPLVTVA